VKARTAGLLLPSGAAQIHVELQIGSDKWCATFADPKRNQLGLFVAGSQTTAPGSCVDYWAPPTTSSTSSTSSTSTSTTSSTSTSTIPDGTQPCESVNNPYCNGTCGGGGTCGRTNIFPNTPCICAPPGEVGCGDATLPTCDGACPAGGACQGIGLEGIPFMCACVPAGGTCGCPFPGECPSGDICYIDGPCGCFPP